MADDTPRKLLRRRAVLDRTGLSQSVLYQLMRAGEFARPVKISARTVAWPEGEVDAWIESRMARRDDDWQQVGEVAERVIEKARRS